MKIIRWRGLATFIGVLVVLTLAWYLLAPKLIANTLEELGSEALGAKVEVASVELSLFPVSVVINQLTAADPEQPMQNLLEAEKIIFSVETAALLWKKIVIDELQVSGVKTATKRQTSGVLEGGRKSTQTISQAVEFGLPEINDIDINSLVAKADLITLKRVAQLKQHQDKLQRQWQQALDSNEFDKNIAEIKREYKRLSERAKNNRLNLIKDRKAWKKLKKSIAAEHKQLASLSDKLKQDKNDLNVQLKLVRQGPGDGLNAIMQQFGLGQGIDGLVNKYLGPQYTPWINRVLKTIKGFKSDNPAATEEQATIQVGKKVYFLDQHSYPELLIKKISLSGSDQNWQLDGKGVDLGYLPWLTGKPAKLNIQWAGTGQAKLAVASNWPSASQMATQVKISIDNWPVEELQVMQTKQGGWKLHSGTLSAKIAAELTLEKIDLVAFFSIASPKLNVPDKIPDWQNILVQSVNKETEIELTITAKGSLVEPKIKLSSSVEKLFKKAIGEKIKQQTSKLTGKVKRAIADKVGDISGLEDFGGNLKTWQSQITDKNALLENLLTKTRLSP